MSQSNAIEVLKEMYCRDCDKIVVPKKCEECSCYDEYATYCTPERPSSLCSRGLLECPECQNSELEELEELELFKKGKEEGKKEVLLALEKQERLKEWLEKEIQYFEMRIWDKDFPNALGFRNKLREVLDRVGEQK